MTEVLRILQGQLLFEDLQAPSRVGMADQIVLVDANHAGDDWSAGVDLVDGLPAHVAIKHHNRCPPRLIVYAIHSISRRPKG